MEILKKYRGIAFLAFIVLLVVIIWINNAVLRDSNEQTQSRAYNRPTATEAFRLRSECAALGQKILDNNIVGSALAQSQVSHYNPETNRCYVQLTVQSADLSGDIFHNYLYDGQTGDILASATKENGKKDSGIIFGGPVESVKSNPTDNSFDATNEYIREVMKDDWKQ